MKLEVAAALAFLMPAIIFAQNNSRRPNQRPFQQQSQPQSQQQQPQFTKRFNPNDNQQNNQQNSFNAQKQQPQQAQPKFTNNNFDSNIRQESTTFIPIIRYDNQQTVDGGYKSLWETGNNILVEETGVLKSFSDKENPEAVVQKGSYTYTSPEGQIITVQYTADENGFRASGDHLPTPPPIPADIQKSLDLIYAGIRQQEQQGQQGQRRNDERFNQQQYNDQQSNNQQTQQQQQQNNRQDGINFRPTGNRNFPNFSNNNNRG